MKNSKQLWKSGKKKGSGTNLIAMEGHFTISSIEEGVGDRKKGPGEISNLSRIVLRANDTTGEKPINLEANIPAAELPSLFKAAELAFEDYITGQKKEKFTLLKGIAKPKLSDKDENGNTLMYIINVEYDSSRNYAVTISVKNFRAKITEKPDGTVTYSNPSKDQPQINYLMEIPDFYNKIAHTYTMYKMSLIWGIIKGKLDDTFGFVKKS